MRGVIVSELIREREAKFSKHPIRTFVRNWPETLSDHPTLSNISATTKAETVFNSGVECFMFVKLACGADTKQSSLVATHSNQFRIPPRRDPEILQIQIKTASSNQFHPHRARGNSTVKLAQEFPPAMRRRYPEHEILCNSSTPHSPARAGPESALPLINPITCDTAYFGGFSISARSQCAARPDFAAAKTDGDLCFGAMSSFSRSHGKL